MEEYLTPLWQRPEVDPPPEYLIAKLPIHVLVELEVAKREAMTAAYEVQTKLINEQNRILSEFRESLR